MPLIPGRPGTGTTKRSRCAARATRASEEAEAKDSLAPVAWSGVRVRVSGLRKRDGLGRLLDASGVPIWDGIEAPEPPDDGPWFEEDEDEPDYGCMGGTGSKKQVD